MAPSPNFRVQESPPFSKVAVDFAGPLYVKGLKGKTRKKYIALFFMLCNTRFTLRIGRRPYSSVFLKMLKTIYCSKRYARVNHIRQRKNF